jgi:ERF superfamily
MTEKNAETPADLPGGHRSLAAALAAAQAEMPKIGKGNRADAGTYSYSYADLADIVAVVGPVMGRHGLSFSSKPTLNDDGKFVLEYRLRHASEQEDVGQYPLPPSGNPQQMGSAQSYARRYCLLAVLNLAPDDDDDGKAAAGVAHDYSGPARSRERASQPAQGAGQQQGGGSAKAADAARRMLWTKAERGGLDRAAVEARYSAQYGGETVDQATDPNRIVAFSKLLTAEPAANGAAQ